MEFYRGPTFLRDVWEEHAPTRRRLRHIARMNSERMPDGHDRHRQRRNFTLRMTSRRYCPPTKDVQ